MRTQRAFLRSEVGDDHQNVDSRGQDGGGDHHAGIAAPSAGDRLGDGGRDGGDGGQNDGHDGGGDA